MTIRQIAGAGGYYGETDIVPGVVHHQVGEHLVQEGWRIGRARQEEVGWDYSPASDVDVISGIHSGNPARQMDM